MAQTARFEFRVRPEDKARIEAAAALAHESASDFARAAAIERADAILRRSAFFVGQAGAGILAQTHHNSIRCERLVGVFVAHVALIHARRGQLRAGSFKLYLHPFQVRDIQFSFSFGVVGHIST